MSREEAGPGCENVREMNTDGTHFTVGKTTFFLGENQTHPLFRIEPGIPCQNAREQASELMDDAELGMVH